MVTINTAIRLHNVTINMEDSGDVNVFPGGGYLDEAHRMLERWLRWCHQKYDYFYDLIEQDESTNLSSVSESSVRFADNYYVTRSRLFLIVEKHRFTRCLW